MKIGAIWQNIFIMSFSRDGKMKNVFVLQFIFNVHTCKWSLFKKFYMILVKEFTLN